MGPNLGLFRYCLLATAIALTISGGTANGKGSAALSRLRVAVVTDTLDPITHDLCCHPGGSHYTVYVSRRVLVNAIESRLRQKSYDVEWWDEVPPRSEYDIRIDVSIYGGVDAVVAKNDLVRVKWTTGSYLKITSSDGSLLGVVDVDALAEEEKERVIMSEVFPDSTRDYSKMYALGEAARHAQKKAMVEILKKIDGSLSSGDVALKIQDVVASKTSPCSLILTSASTKLRGNCRTNVWMLEKVGTFSAGL